MLLSTTPRRPTTDMTPQQILLQTRRPSDGDPGAVEYGWWIVEGDSVWLVDENGTKTGDRRTLNGGDPKGIAGRRRMAGAAQTSIARCTTGSNYRSPAAAPPQVPASISVKEARQPGDSAKSSRTDAPEAWGNRRPTQCYRPSQVPLVVVRATICATIDPPRRHPSPPICHVGFGLILAE